MEKFSIHCKHLQKFFPEKNIFLAEKRSHQFFLFWKFQNYEETDENFSRQKICFFPSKDCWNGKKTSSSTCNIFSFILRFFWAVHSVYGDLSLKNDLNKTQYSHLIKWPRKIQTLLYQGSQFWSSNNKTKYRGWHFDRYNTTRKDFRC